MLLVEIEKSENVTLAAWFSELRGWLDCNNCKPPVFAPAGRRLDRLIYRIAFDHAAQAHLFSQAFARYSPMIRRASASEREQLRAMADGAVASAGADRARRGDGRALRVAAQRD